jgi:acyl-CoA thioesterase
MTDVKTNSPLDDLLAQLRINPDDGSAAAHIDATWMQGRTAYGGISSAIALAAVQALHPSDAPLRYAQISFVGPVGGDCHIATRKLRQSKSSLFVDAVVSGEAGVGTTALFAFSPDRESHIDYNALTAPQVAPPEDLLPLPPHPARPSFTGHFDMRPSTGPRPLLGQPHAEMLTWVRFNEKPSCHPLIALLAMGDALPPAALHMFRQMGPISSMNWTVNMLTSDPKTDDGWWLLKSESHFVRNGLSVQDMTIWNRAGEPVVSGSQAVALYV